MKQFTAGFICLALLTGMMWAQSANEPADAGSNQQQQVVAEDDTSDKVPTFQELSKQLDQGRNRGDIEKQLDKLNTDQLRRLYKEARDKDWPERKVSRMIGGLISDNIHKSRIGELPKVDPGKLPAAKKLKLTVLNYPRVDGSTSTHPLGRIICSRVLGSEICWDKTSTPGGEMPTVYMSGWGSASLGYGNEEFYMTRYYLCADPNRDSTAASRRAQIINGLLVKHNGTHGSYMNLIGGQKDLILVAREPSEDELKAAKKEGVELEVLPVAWDAFVFICNYDNGVDSLKLDDIRKIYTGKITNWKAVGGKDEELKAFQRNRNSGSQELMQQLVMGDRKMSGVSGDMIGTSMAGPYHQIKNHENGLGYSVFFYEHYMAASPFVKLLAVDGVTPSQKTIASGKYRLRSKVYLAIRNTAPKDSDVRKLRDWILSDEGQRVVAESGYVPFKDIETGAKTAEQ